jgi:hypothetical protein
MLQGKQAYALNSITTIGESACFVLSVGQLLCRLCSGLAYPPT